MRSLQISETKINAGTNEDGVRFGSDVEESCRIDGGETIAKRDEGAALG